MPPSLLDKEKGKRPKLPTKRHNPCGACLPDPNALAFILNSRNKKLRQAISTPRQEAIMLNFKQYVSMSSQIGETVRDLQTFRSAHAKKCSELGICKCQLHRRNMAMKLFRFPIFGVGVSSGIGGGGRLGSAVVPVLVEFLCFDLWGEGVRLILLSTGESSDR